MRFWLMGQAPGPLGSVMADVELMKAATLLGTTPNAIREMFRASNANTVDMRLAKPGAPIVEEGRHEIPDFMFWVSTPIFSDRAVSLAAELSCERREFWPCRFQTNPDEKYFFHLPFDSFDVIDYDKSTFLMMLPGTPPLPMFIQTMSTKEIPGPILPCFRASIPDREQVLSELFVLDGFKSPREQSGFSGATFSLGSS